MLEGGQDERRAKRMNVVSMFYLLRLYVCAECVCIR
jgi:hypothetical protein